MSAVNKDGISVDVVELEVPVINVEVVELEAPVVNVEVVEIRGFQGERGQQGIPGNSLEYSGAFETLTALQSAKPVGAKGDTYFVRETNETYSWDLEKKQWVSVGVIKGNSANEILMSPDPEKYFLEIYGQTTGDIIGSLVVNQSPISPDPSDTFASILGM